MRSLARPNKLPRASAATVLSDNKVALGCRPSSQLPRVVISQLSLQTGCWRVQSMVGTMISRRKRCNQQSKQIHNLSSRWCAECLALSSMCFCFNRPSIRVLHWAAGMHSYQPACPCYYSMGIICQARCLLAEKTTSRPPLHGCRHYQTCGCTVLLICYPFAQVAAKLDTRRNDAAVRPFHRAGISSTLAKLFVSHVGARFEKGTAPRCSAVAPSPV